MLEDLEKRKELPLVTELPIHHYYYHHNKERLHLGLHSYCDSLQVLELAGVVNLRADTSVSITLVIAKSKVAPLKTTVTILALIVILVLFILVET